MVGLAAFAAAEPAHAQFASFDPVTGGANSFSFDNNGLSSASVATFTGSAQVNFQFLSFAGSSVLPQGGIAATLTLVPSTTSPATTVSTLLSQPINGSTNSIVIRRNSDNALLLREDFTGFKIGRNEGSDAALRASNTSTPPGIVVYSSQFLQFSATAENSSNVAFTGISPGLALNSTNNILRDFTATTSLGTVTSNGVTAVPEPAALGMLSVGLVGLPGLLAVRRRRKREGASA